MSATDLGFAFGSVGILCVGLVLLILVLCWCVLPFILISKLNAQRKATEASTKQLAYELGKVAQSTRQTAEACAALTVWAERADERTKP